MPALPLNEAGPYVAGAYVAFVALLLVYVAIMSWRLSRIENELRELDELTARSGEETPESAAPAREEVSV
jgi:hypothetical protein